MPGAIQETSGNSTSSASSSTSVLPSPEIRAGINTAIENFIQAVLAHPEMQQPGRHPTLWHVWDFTMRTKYILSELDNIEAGRAVQYPQQIPDYEFSATPAPEKIREHMEDVFTRSLTIKFMVTDPPARLMMMGLLPIDFGDNIKGKAEAMVDSFDGIEEY
ncbi:hypothetical protein V8F20_005879 [Naviculisporaceae sp. PSN 640]